MATPGNEVAVDVCEYSFVIEDKIWAVRYDRNLLPADVTLTAVEMYMLEVRPTGTREDVVAGMMRAFGWDALSREEQKRKRRQCEDVAS